MKPGDAQTMIDDGRRGAARPACRPARAKQAKGIQQRESTGDRRTAIAFAEVTAVPVDHPASALTRGLVRDDEIIILLLRPSLWFVPLSSAGGLLVIGLATFALAYLAQRYMMGFSDTQAFALGVGLGTLRLGWQLLEWLSRVYVLTDRRVICRTGVLRTNLYQAPLRDIQHTCVLSRARERLFGLGTIGFAAAGSQTYQAFWQMIRQPAAIHKIVVDAIKRYGR